MMNKIGHFDICKQMAIDNLDIQLAPLDNVTDLRKTKAGTNVTIGVAGDMVRAIGLDNKYIGGLLLINREQYFATKAKLESDSQVGRLPDAAGEVVRRDESFVVDLHDSRAATLKAASKLS